ncbi:Protein N-acetyltransferase, RimJ/RimL family [Thermomonospora echinospora]|uniref:Protein N-acetyltransferase, RimJ/RimL family n=1 Tax=Thermomonospora echinospora TaxID=1992 RepID=A0A1H6D546_9ACTN|nr:GNAT family N-acetyltransferase [Thermomonospora echinospora]SEG80098.1 Protein N-acetyltransferase, RimJ/RimL family [Thermomonospora echinospora]
MRDLTTVRLILEPWRERHGSELVRLSADERVMRHIGTGVWTRGYATRRHVRALRHWAEHGFGWRAVHARADRSFLGLVSLIRLDAPIEGIAEPALEIGWWVDPRAWGQGIATEAAAAMLDEAFGRIGAETVVARLQAANLGSARVTAKLGLRPFAETTDPDGRLMLMCAITRDEYRRAGGAPPAPPAPPG